MDKKLINRLAVTIEKINYLYRNIRKREENMQKLELALLKKYVTELYDGLVEVELSLKQDTLPEQIMQHPLQQREQLVKEKVLEVEQPEPIAQPEPEPEPVLIPEPEPEPEPEVAPEPEPITVMEEVVQQAEEDIEDLIPTGQIDQSYAQEISNVISSDRTNIDEEVVVDDDGSVKTQILTNLQKSDLLRQDDTDDDETVAMELNDVLGNKKEQSIADKFAAKSGATEFAIGHNQRTEYINHLFGGDDEAYNTAIDDLANAQGYIEALTYVNLNLRYDYKWDDKDPKVREFLDMIKHKFLEGYYS